MFNKGVVAVNMEIKSEKAVPFSEVKQILAKREEQRELGYEQKITLAYLKTIYKAAPTKVSKVIESLKQIEKLNERQISSIVNMLPQDLDDLRVLFSNERADLSAEEKQKVLDAVKELAA